MSFHQEIIQQIVDKKIQNKKQLHNAKIKLCKKYGISDIPPDSEILAHLPDSFPEEEKQNAIGILRRKSMRTISGVAIVAVMTSPESCPHGRCIPCPGGPDNNTPQSYTGYEPAAMRAGLNDFHPFLQTQNRLKQLQAIGHTIDKIDFIIMGGTFTARTPWYQQWFVKQCFDALNQSPSKNLKQAQQKNESAPSRCIGLTIETRPDWFGLQHIDTSLDLGATRVELGVQTIDDIVLHIISRGHTVTDTISATKNAKNSGLKVCYHMMPGLPGSSPQKDIETFETLFSDQRFKPDMLKIYPTLVIEGTKLFDLWKQDNYQPLSTKNASKLIAELKQYVPEWVRIQRIQRDVPSQYISGGVTKSNLRQFVEEDLQKSQQTCRCIRCREIGHQHQQVITDFDPDTIKLVIDHYEACDATELFLSLVEPTQDVLIGYLRLRDIVQSHRWELDTKPGMIIRELKVLGREIPIGNRSKNGFQHRGFGKELLAEAERICREDFDKKNLFVLSGIGVKLYYRKLGFKNTGLYLVKSLDP